ncbi:hypothetical protein ACH4CE_09090 [Streptomyces gelaticus]|uniref:hypothetical protein n=1 Tax=Streptomyces gelaticus TaxID=285446 RepID=UPI00379D9EE3
MSAAPPLPSHTEHHLAVFGDLFDIPGRALKTLGDGVRITLFVPRSRLAACDGVEHAHAVVALADDADATAWTDAVRAVHAAVPLTHALALVDHLAYEAAVAMSAIGIPFHAPTTMERVADKALMPGPVWFGAAREATTFTGADLPSGEHVQVTALRAEGDPVRPLASTNDRAVKVRATGTTAEEALTLARETAAEACAALSLDLSLTDPARTL